MPGGIFALKLTFPLPRALYIRGGDMMDTEPLRAAGNAERIADEYACISLAK